MGGPDGAGGALGGDGDAGALADEGVVGAGGAEGALQEAAAERRGERQQRAGRPGAVRRDDEDAGRAADEGGTGGGGGSARDEAAEAEAPAAAGAEGEAPDGREGAAAEAHVRKIAKRVRKSAAAAASASVRRRPLSALERQDGDWRPWGQPCYFRREEQPASAFAEGELTEAAPEEEATAAAARDARERRLREEMAALAPARVAYKERSVLAQLRDAALARGAALRAPGRALGRALVAAEAAEAQLREELGAVPERELEHEESRLRAAREKARRAQEAVRATWLHPDQRTKARAAETASALRDQAAVRAPPRRPAPCRAAARGAYSRARARRRRRQAVARLRGKMERFGALGGELAELRRATAAVSLGATAWEVRAEGLARDAAAAAAGHGAAPLLVLEGRGSGRPVSPPLRVHVRDPRPRGRAPAAAPPALPQTLRLGRRGSERRAGGVPAADGAARGGGASEAGVGGAGARRGAAGMRSGWVWREEANGVTGQSAPPPPPSPY